MAGYGLGTRIRATLDRILIPGPATDPHLRIRGPGACLRSTDEWTFGLFLDFFTDSFDLNFTWKRYALWSALRGDLRFRCEIWIKTRKIVGTAFSNYTQVFTRVEGGIGGPNPPNGALGSPVKTSRNLFRKIKLQSSCMFFTITFA